MKKSSVISQFFSVPAPGEEVLAGADRGHFHRVRAADGVCAVERRGAIHLHTVLMPTRILGISAYYHDSAACLVEDGRIVAAAQEERFTRKKHDANFPSRAVEYCLREGRHHHQGAGPGRLLREATRQVRSTARNLRRVRAARLAVVSDGDADVAQRQAVDGRTTSRSSLEGYDGEVLLRRAPRVACGVGVLPVALRASGDRHNRRRRRVGDLVDRRWPRVRRSRFFANCAFRIRWDFSTLRSPILRGSA